MIDEIDYFPKRDKYKKKKGSDNGENYQTLYVKALELVSDDKSKIIISERYKRLILANAKTINTICNGNFILLVE